MAVIKAQKIPKKPISPDDILSRFCCLFPVYTYAKAKELPFVRIKKMISMYEKEYARKMIDLTRIVAAPYSKKGVNVGKLIDEFKQVIES